MDVSEPKMSRAGQSELTWGGVTAVLTLGSSWQAWIALGKRPVLAFGQ